MSYQSKTPTRGTQYREMEILAASPARLVVLMFEHLEVSMRRARIAIDQGNVEQRVVLLGKARAILSELLGTLDFEKGGTIATELAQLYSFLLAELTDVGIRRDVQRLDRLVKIVNELREGFTGAAATVEREGMGTALAGTA
ncbi:MAG: flagellar export chaperone FliS [Gemmatimonadaceae bacterium]|nr:flagellar export chaperone FliS [Gemmatimonadaceae bacterium]